jgi:hypothetical protein
LQEDRDPYRKERDLMPHSLTDIVDLPGDDDFIRLPGLFRRWELNDVVELGADFHLEDAGEAADGTQLIAVYRRERHSTHDTNTTDSTSTPNPNDKEP